LNRQLRRGHERGVVQLERGEWAERRDEAHHALDLDPALAGEPAELARVGRAVVCSRDELVRFEGGERGANGVFVPFPALKAGPLLERAEALLEEADDVPALEPGLTGRCEHAQD